MRRLRSASYAALLGRSVLLFSLIVVMVPASLLVIFLFHIVRHVRTSRSLRVRRRLGRGPRPEKVAVSVQVHQVADLRGQLLLRGDRFAAGLLVLAENL